MNLRAFLIVPTAIVVAVLAGCGQGVASGSGAGSGSAQRYVPSNSMCYEPAYIRQHAPEGACSDVVADDVVADDDSSSSQGR
ncbi:hypothetical protein ACFWN7_11560 [Agromyces sp. NPDC058484]|uniref:hypothetical protein n=1 Tax=Agromyces sp. NPDC058484 TaxID=3346524 RepID=UPI0036682EB8